jgi:hypothetical protein
MRVPSKGILSVGWGLGVGVGWLLVAPKKANGELLILFVVVSEPFCERVAFATVGPIVAGETIAITRGIIADATIRAIEVAQIVGCSSASKPLSDYTATVRLSGTSHRVVTIGAPLESTVRSEPLWLLSLARC